MTAGKEQRLTHVAPDGTAKMVDVSGKPETERVARATGRVRMRPETAALVRDKALAKGDVLEVARLAGIMAAKRTGELIPLCHPLPLTSVALDFGWEADDLLRIEATAQAPRCTHLDTAITRRTAGTEHSGLNPGVPDVRRGR